MKILIFTDKEDYVRVIGLLSSDIHKSIDVEVISECRLANIALTHPHDIIIIDDRIFDKINAECLEILERAQMSLMVFLQYKKNIKRYLHLNVLDYFVSPLRWHAIEERIRLQYKRMTALEHLEHVGEIPHKYVVKDKDSVHFLNYSDILFFEMNDKQLHIHTKDGLFKSHESLKKALVRLPEHFIRVHSSYIVNFNNVLNILNTGNRNYRINFNDYSKYAMMSRKKAEELMKDQYNHYRLSYINEKE